MLEPAPFQTLDQILPVFWVVVQVDDLSLIMPFDLLSASPVEGRLQLLTKKRNLSPLRLPFHLEGSGRNEASGLINYIKNSPFMLMECEEADVLKMIYNISYFSEEKNDKLDDV